MGWVHRLSDIDTEARTAVCANCGPVGIRRQDEAWRYRQPGAEQLTEQPGDRTRHDGCSSQRAMASIASV